MVKKPYIKKYGKFCGFMVWIVDGKYIRDNLDEEFTNYGQNYQFKFIPKKEFWLDKEMDPGEEKYYIDSMLVMNRMISEGVSHNKALEKADRLEKSERAKSKLMKKEMKVKDNKKKLIKDIHVKLLKEYSKKVNVWVVNGEIVRDLFFIDFTEGGHHVVYPFVPEDEIWLDDDLVPCERKFVLLHEAHERNLMKKGMCYNDAHKDSSKIEYYCRRHPKKLNKFLKKELEDSGIKYILKNIFSK